MMNQKSAKQAFQDATTALTLLTDEELSDPKSQNPDSTADGCGLSIRDAFLLVLAILTLVGYFALAILLMRWLEVDSLIGALLVMAPIIFLMWVSGEIK